MAWNVWMLNSIVFPFFIKSKALLWLHICFESLLAVGQKQWLDCEISDWLPLMHCSPLAIGQRGGMAGHDPWRATQQFGWRVWIRNLEFSCHPPKLCKPGPRNQSFLRLWSPKVCGEHRHGVCFHLRGPPWAQGPEVGYFNEIINIRWSRVRTKNCLTTTYSNLQHILIQISREVLFTLIPFMPVNNRYKMHYKVYPTS